MTASPLPKELLGSVEDRGGVLAWVMAKVVGGIVCGVDQEANGGQCLLCVDVVVAQ